MDHFIITIIGTLLLLLISSIVIAIVIFIKNKSISKQSEDNLYILKWKYGKIIGCLTQILVLFSFSIHLFILVFFIKTSNGIMAMDWGIGKLLSYLLMILAVGLFGLLSIPKLISFCQFLAFEYKRIVVYNEKEKIISIFNQDGKFTYKHGDFVNIQFSLQRKFSYRDTYTLDYVKMMTTKETEIIFTSLLLEIIPSFDLQSMCKGVQEVTYYKTFNLIR